MDVSRTPDGQTGVNATNFSMCGGCLPQEGVGSAEKIALRAITDQQRARAAFSPTSITCPELELLSKIFGLAIKYREIDSTPLLAYGWYV